MDEDIPQTVSQLTTSLASCIGALVAIAISTNGALMILLFPIIIAFTRIQKFFHRTNTAVARLESISRSPIYTNFSETLSGNTYTVYILFNLFVHFVFKA